MSWISTGPWPTYSASAAQDKPKQQQQQQQQASGSKSQEKAQQKGKDPAEGSKKPGQKAEKAVANADNDHVDVTAGKNLLFPDVPEKISFPKEEERVLAYWEEIDAFKTSLKLSEGRPRYTFYDGPPFATGLPHYGHLLAGSIKDIVTRYAHQRGFYVERRFGWDCHGLPIEYEIDKEYGIKNKEDVLKIGIAEYNRRCRGIVMRFSKEWESTVKRMGRWIDFENDYKTMNPNFMESVWWVFSQLFAKDLVYRGYKVMPYSTGCSTPLSNFEASQNYKEVSDPAVVVSFPLVDEPDVHLLAWTTTPWTLPSNLALCMSGKFEYIKILDKKSGRKYILLEKRLSALYKDPVKSANEFQILEKVNPNDLKDKKYTPLFDYFYEKKKDTAFRVLIDDYVTDDSGTGIVHQAPAFGEDDFRVCSLAKVFEKGEAVICPVDDTGCFTPEVTHFAGAYVKTADKEIIKHLKQAGRLVVADTVVHNYPFCWRSDTPLLYKAVPSWFVRVEVLVEKLLANNKKSYWVPEFVQEKRFHNWLHDARDWNISRNRYWGTPIPLWVSENFEEIVCVSSIEQLKELSGVTVTDLHKENVDGITIPSKKGNGVLRRVEEVFDCWFESGSMPYAQQHYPFENKEVFEKSFPADFIAEGLDQTRGWFYTLLVISTALFDQPPFKNLIVNGLVLASDGKKMSKRLKNYPDPVEILAEYGADALRLYLINSPVVRAEPLRFKKEGVFAVIKDVFLPWYNAYRFFLQNARRLELEEGIIFTYDEKKKISSTNVMDTWILAALQSLIQFVIQEMTYYRLSTVVPRLVLFIDELTNWYVRFNRKRLKGENGKDDCTVALQTLFEVLFTLCKLMSPFTPFLTENMYQNLKIALPKSDEDMRSIHFLSFPEPKQEYFNEDIQRQVSRMQRVIELGRVARERRAISLKNPLPEIIVVHKDAQLLADVKSLEDYILEELNVKELICTSDDSKYDIKARADPDFKALGQRLGEKMKALGPAIKAMTQEQIKAFLSNGSIELVGETVYANEVTIVSFFESSEQSHLQANSEKDLVIILNCDTSNQSLIHEAIAREVMNRVQRLRKEVQLNATDDVLTYFEVLNDNNNNIAAALAATQELISKTLKKGVLPKQAFDAAKLITEKEVEVKGSTMKVYLVWP